jgi:hypothetical protein
VRKLAGGARKANGICSGKKVAVRKDKRKEAGHYSGLNENKRSKNF